MSLSAKPDMKVTATDALDYDGQEAPATRRRLWPALIAGATLTAIVLVAWLVYGQQILAFIGAGGSGQVPVVVADGAPIKVRPAKPGGMNVPNQDKLVYQRMDGTNSTATHVERLLPPPEKPLPKSAIASQDATGSGSTSTDASGGQAALNTVPSAQTVADATQPAPAPPPPTSPPGTATTGSGGPTRLVPSDASGTASTSSTSATPAPATTASAPATMTTASTQPATSPSATPASAPPPPAAPKPAASQQAAPKPTTSTATKQASLQPPASKTVSAPAFHNAYRVQLLASRSQSGAEAEWRKIRNQNKDLLGSLALNLTRVDLGKNKGVYYRVRVGPLADEAAAKTLCARLKQRKQGCLVVRPGG